MQLSQTALAVEPSPTRQLFNLARQYTDVIDFTLGDPDLMPAAAARQGGIRSIESGRTRYSENAGLPELRRAIAGYLHGLYGCDVDPASEVIATAGAMEALFLTLTALIDPGDEVILIGPYYVNYLQMVRMRGSVPVIVFTDSKNGYRIDPERLRAAVTPKTKAIMVNNPTNPTGAVLTRGEVEAIACIAKENDITVVFDEVYRSLVYEGKHFSIMQVPGMMEHAVLIDSFSKEFCMTGWRLGYAVGNAELVAAMTRLNENVVACAPLVSQYAGIEVLQNGSTGTNEALETYRTRRDALYEKLQSAPGCVCNKPAGTFYMFADISASGLSSMEFALRLLKEQQVAVVPGIAYGEPYDTHVRFAYTVPMDRLNEGAERFVRFMQSLC